ncbi:MAG: DUF4340 domain-containing protein [Bacteroidota bacterium]
MLKNKYILLFTIILAVIAFILILKSSKTTIKADFAVEDVSAITKIFMSDKNNNSVTIKRLDEKKWEVNDKYPARIDGMEILLETISKLHVKEPVSKAGRNTIIKWLAAKSVKVEIYQMVYRIDLFNKIRLFPHEKCTKVYYVGDETQDNQGTFMLLEGSDEPFIVYVPGFRGFLTPRYSALEFDWRKRIVFDSKIGDIKTVKIEYPSAPESSFEISRFNRDFEIKLLFSNKIMNGFDTSKVLNFMNSFANLGLEAFLNDLKKSDIDSIVSHKPMAIVTLTNIADKTTVLKAFIKPAAFGSLDDVTNQPLLIDRDRFYGLINDDKDFVFLQYFTYNSIFQPSSYFKIDVDKKSKE